MTLSHISFTGDCVSGAELSQILRLDRHDLSAIFRRSVLRQRLLVQLQKGVTPGELRQDLLRLGPLAQDHQGGGEGLDGRELERLSEVDGVCGDEEGEGPRLEAEVAEDLLGVGPGAVEGRKASAHLHLVGGREGPLGEGAEDETAPEVVPPSGGPGEAEPLHLPSGAPLGIALVCGVDEEIHGPIFYR